MEAGILGYGLGDPRDEELCRVQVGSVSCWGNCSGTSWDKLPLVPLLPSSSGPEVPSPTAYSKGSTAQAPPLMAVSCYQEQVK